MNTRINTGLTFQAKMNVNEIITNREKWSRVAKIFEKQTPNYPKDEFVFSEDAKYQDITFYINHEDKKLNCDEDNTMSTIQPIVKNILNLIPDETVAEKIKKLFLIQKKADMMEADIGNFNEKYDFYNNIKDNSYDKFLESYYALKRAYLKNILEKDDVLKIPDGIQIY